MAVSAPAENTQRRAAEVLMGCGARVLEMGDGHIAEGDWKDFDPSATPNLLDASQYASAGRRE